MVKKTENWKFLKDKIKLQRKKKSKTETDLLSDDFSVIVICAEIGLLPNDFIFQKKKKGEGETSFGENDFTFNVVLHWRYDPILEKRNKYRSKEQKKNPFILFYVMLIELSIFIKWNFTHIVIHI